MRPFESFEEHCYCSNNKWDCVWSQEVKLEASDKSSHAMFGSSLAVSQRQGLIAVGAPSSYRFGELGTCIGEDAPGGGDAKRDSESGTVYLFTRMLMFRDAAGLLKHYPAWGQTFANMATEHETLQELEGNEALWSVYPGAGSAVSEQAKIGAIGPRGDDDHFGSSVALDLDTHSLVIGATGESCYGMNSGAAYIYDTEFRRVQFTKSHDSIAEANPGDHNGELVQQWDKQHEHFTSIVLNVIRGGDTSKALHVHYSTSDHTATGVSEGQAELCYATAHEDRSHSICGDYVQTSGDLYFAPNEQLAKIVIQITDDECYEPGTEEFHVQLSVLGGDPIVGELSRMTIRIDDNDSEHLACCDHPHDINNIAYSHCSQSKPDSRMDPV